MATVLVIDDSGTAAEYMRIMLEERNNHKMVRAKTLNEAYQAINTNLAIDGAVVDIMVKGWTRIEDTIALVHHIVAQCKGAVVCSGFLTPKNVEALERAKIPYVKKNGPENEKKLFGYIDQWQTPSSITN